MRTRSLLLLAIVGLAAAPPATAGEPSAADLIKLAPTITSADPKVRSIEMAGTMRMEGLRVRFRAIYRAPDRYAILFADGSDGTPLVFIADRQMLVYDPIRPSVLFMKDGHFNMAVRQKGEKSMFHWEFGKSSHIKDEITFDAKSLFDRPAVAENVVRDGDRTYRLFRTDEQGGTVVYSIDRAGKQPIESIRAFGKDGHEATLTIDRVVVDGPLKDEEFRFPDKTRLAENIDVHDWPGDGLLETFGEVAVMMRAFQARKGANHPGLRHSIRFPGFRRIDWDEVRENDRKFSAVLKEFLPASPDGPLGAFDLPELPPGGPRRAGPGGLPVAGAGERPSR